ncbi:MAG TPA: exopolygalacturonase, partial [Bacteroidales bacterium]
DLKGRKDMPASSCENITLRNINLKCETFYNVKSIPNAHLSNFLFEDLNIEAQNSTIDKSLIQGLTLRNVHINKQLMK